MARAVLRSAASCHPSEVLVQSPRCFHVSMLFCVATALCACGDGIDDPGESIDRAEAAITDGVPDHVHPFVGTMLTQRSDGSFAKVCTGSLVSPTLFLTAGHC